MNTTLVVTLLAVTLGLLLSPIPAKFGLYRWIASLHPPLIGMFPATATWGFTFEQFNESCSSITGQNALVTGANSGIGFEIARGLARCGVHVTLACRNPERCRNAADTIKSQTNTNGAILSTMTVDTSSLASVKSFSEQFVATNNVLDMLFLNAGRGVNMKESKDGSVMKSDEGIELLFATNYLGHHLMYKILEPTIRKSVMGRVVLTASAASFDTFPYKVATSLEQLHGETASQKDLRWYGQSKLAQILWAKKVTRQLGPGANVFVNAAHPGAVDTPIFDKLQLPEYAQKILSLIRGKLFWTPEEGALTLLFLGVAVDKLKDSDIRGRYYHPQTQEVINPFALDEQLQDDLWNFSEKLVYNIIGKSENTV